jgi:hypothetical protein
MAIFSRLEVTSDKFYRCKQVSCNAAMYMVLYKTVHSVFLNLLKGKHLKKLALRNEICTYNTCDVIAYLLFN